MTSCAMCVFIIMTPFEARRRVDCCTSTMTVLGQPLLASVSILYWITIECHSYLCLASSTCVQPRIVKSQWPHPQKVSMQEIWRQMQVGGRRVWNVGVSRKIRESWQVCSQIFFTYACRQRSKLLLNTLHRWINFAFLHWQNITTAKFSWFAVGYVCKLSHYCRSTWML